MDHFGLKQNSMENLDKFLFLNNSVSQMQKYCNQTTDVYIRGSTGGSRKEKANLDFGRAIEYGM